MAAQLQYFDGRNGHVVRLGDEPVVIGGRGGELRVPGATVSRRHARVYKDGDRYWIEDLGGAGVWVNGVKTERRALKNHDSVRIGDLALEYFED